MNLLPLILLGGVALWAVSKREPDRVMVRGARYVVVYALPPNFPVDAATLEQLSGILPPDTAIERDGQRLIVTLTAVSTEQIGDIATPFGVLRLVTLRRLSEVVGSGWAKPMRRSDGVWKPA